MRLLVVGGDGMLGHRLLAVLAARHTVCVTLRHALPTYAGQGLFGPDTAIGGVDVQDFALVERAVAAFRPDAVINAVGIVKQRDSALDPMTSITVNALLPHRLADLCARIGARLILVGTDCVFSGRRGFYSEADEPDPVDLYGRSKLLGEIADAAHVLTLRTSIIGTELGRRQGLLEWFLGQQGAVRGFTRAVFSGLTTVELARVIERLLTEHQDLAGLYHVAAAPIDKAALLMLLRDAFGLATEIIPDPGVVIDRSLDPTRFYQATGYQAPSWTQMVGELTASRL
jgi:dTDP-4-dehydrorhamnose reductase